MLRPYKSPSGETPPVYHIRHIYQINYFWDKFLNYLSGVNIV